MTKNVFNNNQRELVVVYNTTTANKKEEYSNKEESTDNSQQWRSFLEAMRHSDQVGLLVVHGIGARVRDRVDSNDKQTNKQTARDVYAVVDGDKRVVDSDKR